MARMSDKEFSIRHQLIQLRRDRNRLERIKERTDTDLDETRVAIKSLKSSLVEIEMEKRAERSAAKKKSKKKAAAPKKESRHLRPEAHIESMTKKKVAAPKKITDAEAVHVPEEKISEVKVDADSMKAIEDSIEVEVEEKKPAEKKAAAPNCKHVLTPTKPKPAVEVEEKKPAEKKTTTKEKDDTKTDPA